MTRYCLVPALLVAATPTAARADTTINFFGDINYSASNEGTTTNTFQASSLDVFASQTEGKFTFIGEMIVEAFGTNDFGIDVDRLEVSYKPTPWLRLRAGRIRSAFGYYGDAYQNGKFFMTPVSWPTMYEGDGYDGLLPSHSIGIHADVAKELGDQAGKITVDAEVLNGRGIDLGEVPAFKDSNNGKAFNVRLRYVGEDQLDGLIVGGNLYLDDIPEDTTPGVEHGSIHEQIVGGHVAYMAHHVHAVGELAWVRHREHGMDVTQDTLAAFGEVGYGFGDYTPFVRYEYQNIPADDAYFMTSGLESGPIHIVSTGVKYAASASVVVKVQGEVEVAGGVTSVESVAQAAFAF
jgi:hypothetical protein